MSASDVWTAPPPAVHGIDAAGQVVIRQQTAVINVIRAHVAEFGIVSPVGRKGGSRRWLDVVANPNDKRVPVIARACLAALGAQLRRQRADSGVRPYDHGLASISSANCCLEGHRAIDQ